MERTCEREEANREGDEEREQDMEESMLTEGMIDIASSVPVIRRNVAKGRNASSSLCESMSLWL